MSDLSEPKKQSRRPLLSSRLADSRLAIFNGFVVLSIFVAGLYGILHNQVSYTVSPEYFTKFKFLQFGLIELPWPNRVKASLVGFLASWWMGLPIGLLVGAGGFLQHDARQMRHALLWSIAVVVAVTVLMGLVGLLIGLLVTDNPANGIGRRDFVPGNVQDPVTYMRAGILHAASYAGGVLGIGAAWIAQVAILRRSRSRL